MFFPDFFRHTGHDSPNGSVKSRLGNRPCGSQYVCFRFAGQIKRYHRIWHSALKFRVRLRTERPRPSEQALGIHHHRCSCNCGFGLVRFVDVSLGQVHRQNGTRAVIQAALDVLRSRNLWIRHVVWSRSSIDRQLTSTDSSRAAGSNFVCVVLFASSETGQDSSSLRP